MKNGTVKKASKVVKKHDVSKTSTSAKTEKSVIDLAIEIISNTEIDNIETNEYCRMQYEIAEKLVEYDRIRKKCEITDKAHSATINRLAKPFLDGHFTLAVVGKMSSGKSTFINTLIGDNLFPTGHFQTTSTLTYIEKGDEVKMEVLFSDEHKETICDDIERIKERLKQLVSIPEEYHNLPINDINILISGGDDIEEILKKKEGIEELTHTSSDQNLWKKYVKTHKKKDIVKVVRISHPLPTEYQGWRIIDTPGIGATGGIQDATKMLFAESDDDNNKIVDAIIFLHSGTDNIEDESARSFMEKIVKGLTDDAKQRLFFVLTKASVTSFRSHKEEILQKAKELYAKTFNIPENRFTYIDSLLERFNNEVKDKEHFDLLECPSNWESDEWEQMTDLYTPINKLIHKNGKQMTSPAIEEVMKDWSNFGHFKSIINKFMREEKAVIYKKIFSLIEEDCLGFMNAVRYQISVLEGEKDIQKEKEKLTREKIKHNDLLNKLKRKASIDNVWLQFSFVDDRIMKFSSIASIDLIRTAYLELIDDALEKETELFDGFQSEFKDYYKKESDVDYHPTLDLIDFDELACKAEAENTDRTVVTDYSRPEQEKIKDKTMSSDAEYKTIYPHKKTEITVDWEKKRRDFAAYVIKEANNRTIKFKKELDLKVKAYYNQISKELESRYTTAINELDILEAKLTDKNNQLISLRKKLEVLESLK